VLRAGTAAGPPRQRPLFPSPAERRWPCRRSGGATAAARRDSGGVAGVSRWQGVQPAGRRWGRRPGTNPRPEAHRFVQSPRWRL